VFVAGDRVVEFGSKLRKARVAAMLLWTTSDHALRDSKDTTCTDKVAIYS